MLAIRRELETPSADPPEARLGPKARRSKRNGAASPQAMRSTRRATISEPPGPRRLGPARKTRATIGLNPAKRRVIFCLATSAAGAKHYERTVQRRTPAEVLRRDRAHHPWAGARRHSSALLRSGYIERTRRDAPIALF
jgi:hypothetical protein